MDDPAPAPRRISTVPSAVNLNRRNIFAVRDWPPGCGPPSAPSDQSQPSEPQSAGITDQPATETIKESEIPEAKIENFDKPELVENKNKLGGLEGQNGNVGENWGSSSKRWMESKIYPPTKRREVSAIRDFLPGGGRNLDSNSGLNANQTEIETNNQENDQQEKAKVCTEIVLWEPTNEKPKSDSSLPANEKQTSEIRSTNSSYTDLTSLVRFEENKDEEDEAALYDFAIRTITDSRLCLRKTARKSVLGPSKLVLSERKSNKNESSTALTLYKQGIQIPIALTAHQNNTDARSKVKQILRCFHTVYRKKIQKEESKSKSKSCSKENSIFRIDLKSSNVVKKSTLYKELNNAILGPVPGVEIGDEFRYRVELHLIGLHRPPQSGIDWTDLNGVRVATSIVSSGGYSDRQCSSDVLIYSGAGGKPTGKKGQKSKPADQKLEKGNLALKNSMDLKMPVRVIHGLNTSDTSKVMMNFTYDGLYMVVDYQYIDEIYNFNNKEYKAKVFKFILRRMAGQPEIGLHIAGKLKSSKVRDGLCMMDISNRKEKIPICVINTIDNEKPPKFNYMTNCVYPCWYKKTLPKGCNCKGNCTGIKCSCTMKNGGNIPFISNGAIVEEKAVIYECGPACKCPPSCPNQVSQNGIIYPLEIFRTELREWGVRSLSSISCGSFVCEYVGEMIVQDEAITIDAGERGNAGRFLKRSRSPNLMAQKVLFDHDNERMAHVMFFAAENIPPLQELAY